MSSTTYKVFGSVKVNGVKKVVYRKVGSSKNYVIYKGRKVGLQKYKSFMAKKLLAKKKGGNILDSLRKLLPYKGGDGEVQPVQQGGSLLNGSFLASAVDLIKGGGKKQTKQTTKKQTKKTTKKTSRK